MSVNKDALFRYKVINDCLRNNMRRWTKQDLLNTINEKLEERHGWDGRKKRIEIKDRQLNYDLNDMQSLYGAPITQVRDGRQYFYKYEDPDFSIEQQQVSEDDLKQLQQAVHLLQQIKGFSISEEIAGVVSRLENRIRMGEGGASKAIEFENPPVAIGVENLGDIYESIIHRRVLKIHYRPFKAPEGQDHIIHPYFLKEYNNRWFLFGWNEERGRLENLPLDRMSSIKVVSKAYRPNDCFNPDSFFRDMVGVTQPVDAHPENIEIKIKAERAPYLISKPLHNSQQVAHRYKDGSARISYKLIINKELVAHLLSFGCDIEILKPETLRKSIREMLEKALQQYGQPE